MVFSKIIAIDGPSGSGKSTIAKEMAKRLGLVHIDTGAMFRALGLSAHKRNIVIHPSPEINQFLASLKIVYGKSSDCLIEIDGENLTTEIRQHFVSDLASKISVIPEVRTFLLEFQRKLVTEKVSVMEGRDIGTVVFPNSFCKIFVTASAWIRAERRMKELREKGNLTINFDQVLQDVQARDESDCNRAHAPLKQAEDATLVDTSEMTLEEVIVEVCRIAKDRATRSGFSL